MKGAIMIKWVLASLSFLSLGANAQDVCSTYTASRPFDEARHKAIYKVGVLALRGKAAAFAERNETFSTYLSATAGQRFDPPIQFEMVPLDFDEIFTYSEAQLVDFIYMNPSAFSCVEAEYGAQSLVSQISRMVVAGETYDLSEFGGVIAVRADNDEINSIQDLKDKIIACPAISSLGGAQMQFRAMQNAGMSYIQDPSQMVFTSNHGKALLGMLDGDFDVAFVRTDQIEQTLDKDGNLIDPSTIKVIDPKADLNIEGQAFPFLSSTQLYPEWNVASLDSVPDDVSLEVQSALLALADHAEASVAVQLCESINSFDFCNSTTITHKRCDTTPEIAEIARRAIDTGHYAGFRTTLSYAEVRSMLHDTNFMTQDEITKVWHCMKPAKLYHAISCPPGHFLKSKEDVDNGCLEAGLDCIGDYECICKPCIESYDVDIYPDGVDTRGAGCSKMSLCGTMEQREPLGFYAVDNKKRIGSYMNVTVREGNQEPRAIQVQHDPLSQIYNFSITAEKLGILIVEIFLEGEQISESPLRVQVFERTCQDELHEADEEGICICMDNSITINDKCLPYSTLFTIIFVPIILIALIFVYLYVEKKKKEADSMWLIDKNELKFHKPPIILGQGSFGVVLLAEYRGTEVAVKNLKFNSMITKTVGIESREDEECSSHTETNTNHHHEDSHSESPVDLDVENNGEEAKVISFDDVENVLKKKEAEYRLRSDNTSKGEAFHSTDTVPSRGSKSFVIAGGDSSMKAACSLGTKSMHNSTIGRFNSRFASRQKAHFISEMRLLSKLRHPCITTVMGAVISKTQEATLVMEYMSLGSLQDCLHNESFLIEADLFQNIIRDIVSGIRFLHSAKPAVVHGDLKSANVLIDSKFHAKVADFGLAQNAINVRGTPFWMAPELLRQETANNIESDMYSVGIILFELYSRKHPYEGEDPREVISLVCDTKVNKRPPVPSSCPPVMASLMKKLMDADPSKRPSATDLDLRLKDLDVSVIAPIQMTLKRRNQKEEAASKNDLLYKVFPRHIADVLARGGKPEPEEHFVTIFFSDIVGFTTCASTLPPKKVADLLDRLYLVFDKLSQKYELFKIETIGDAYMCASNLALKQHDHVRRIAEFALESVKAASEIPIDEDDPAKGNVAIRAGFHSGHVVSNVIGSLNPRYGLFGDTVNVASRMESTSERGRVHCSDSSARLLMSQAPHIPLELRGATAIKGKGMMQTYFVNNPC